MAVVVPTYNRSAKLLRLLESLRLDAARDSAPAIEVIVVDDGSTDDTPQVLQHFAQASSLKVRVLRLDTNRGRGAARNAGWRLTTAPMVCFTDDDCIVRPGWLEVMVAALERADIVQGQTVAAPDQVHHRGPFAHTMEVPHEDGNYATCNIGYRRSTLELVDGFDEGFQAYAEDTDLAWRAIDAGATTIFVENAVVEHEVRPSGFVAHLTELRRREGLVLAVRNHPGLRARMPYRGYLRPAHLPALALVLCALLAATRPADPVALGMTASAGTWYAVVCHRQRWGPPSKAQWLFVLPMALVADLYEMVVLGRASIKYRRLVL